MDERELTTIDEARSDATPATSPAPSPAPGPADGDEHVTPERVREALKQVIDPELGLNIVDLGLVYDVQVGDRGDVDIQYSLTTMGCPIGPLIEDQMRAFLAALPGIGEVRPEFVIRPAWTPEMMSDEAKAALGIF
jgi:metal-sulfur cluster biosynthetic enzyme